MNRRNYLFWASLLLLVLHQLTQKVLGISIPILDNHLDPLLSMPIVLHLFKWERSFWWKYQRELSFFEIISATLIFSVLFEVLFPYWHSGFYGDWWDVLGYWLGALLYGALLFVNRYSLIDQGIQTAQ